MNLDVSFLKKKFFLIFLIFWIFLGFRLLVLLGKRGIFFRRLSRERLGGSCYERLVWIVSDSSTDATTS